MRDEPENRLKTLDRDFDQFVPPDRRKTTKKRKPLTVNERISIVHRVLVQFDKVQDVAREYRVRQGVVN